jgi:hypothetical protein
MRFLFTIYLYYKTDLGVKKINCHAVTMEGPFHFNLVN